MAAETASDPSPDPNRLSFHKPVEGRMTVLNGREEGRSARRYKVFKPGHFAVNGVSAAIHLLDISQSGAKAHAQRPPNEADLVMIECGVSLGKARILWVSANRFGLQFLLPLSQETIAELIGR